jgi:hypothetical protein
MVEAKTDFSSFNLKLIVKWTVTIYLHSELYHDSFQRLGPIHSNGRISDVPSRTITLSWRGGLRAPVTRRAMLAGA